MVWRTRSVLLLALCCTTLVAPRASAHLPTDIRELGDRIAASPGDVGLLLQRSDAFRRERMYEPALADLRMVEALRPADPRPHLLRALIFYETGRLGRAVQSVDAFISATGGTVEAFWLRARIDIELGRLDDAVRDFDEALARGDNVEIYLSRGRVHEALGRLDDAAVGYEAGVHAMAGAVVLREALIRVERARGHPERALPHIEAVLAQARTRTQWLLLRADVLGDLGRVGEALAARREALADAARAVAIRPSGMALIARAEALLALGRRAEALEDLRRAVRVAPRLSEARSRLAEVTGEGG